MKKEEAMEPKLEKALAELRQIPPRDQVAEARGKASFLHQAAVMRTAGSRKQATHPTSWLQRLFSGVPGTGHRLAFKPLVAVVLAVIILFGGMSSTVLAAQESLPDQALYPLKTWSEDTLLKLPVSQQTQLDRLLDFSDRRVEEIAGLIAAGRAIPEGVLSRLQAEVEQSLEVAASMDDQQIGPQLEGIRMRLEKQLQMMNALLEISPGSDQPLLQQGCIRMREQIQLVTEGEVDPQGFRMKMHGQQQNQQGPGGQTTQPGNGMQGPTSTCMPGENGMQTPKTTPIPGGMGNGDSSGSGQPGGNGGQDGGTPQNPDNGKGTSGKGQKP
jgi:hypothetical protein